MNLTYSAGPTATNCVTNADGTVSIIISQVSQVDYHINFVQISVFLVVILGFLLAWLFLAKRDGNPR